MDIGYCLDLLAAESSGDRARRVSAVHHPGCFTTRQLRPVLVCVQPVVVCDSSSWWERGSPDDERRPKTQAVGGPPLDMQPQGPHGAS